MSDICKDYSTKINKNMDSLLFLYEGSKVNFELSFKEHANDIDRNNHEMKILVNKNESNINVKNINNNNITISNTINANSNSKKVDCLKNEIFFGKIKSEFTSKIIFSHLTEKFKLKVIKYNKQLQNKMNIKLINYKFYSGRYIIYETKIKGKEYEGYTDVLLFEGGYLNGERNGKGKEYYEDGRLRFEGEYLNGKRNGKGKEYKHNGELIFVGKYNNGERNNIICNDILKNKFYSFENREGYIKEYYPDGRLRFEGEYLN